MAHKFVVSATMLLLATLLISYTDAGVVRIDAGSKVSVQGFSEKETREVELDTTTTKAMEDDATEVITESLPPLVAVSRDEDATIVIENQSTLDPAPGTVDDIVVVLEPFEEKENKSEINQQKSAALLLLSVPKLEKPKEIEENIEEPEEDLPQDGETTEATTTTQPEESDAITTVKPLMDEEEAKTVENTPLAPLNETQKSQCGAEKTDDSASPTTLQQTVEVESVPNDKFGVEFLIADADSDYVLVHEDVEDIGSFTHVDSDEYLQPIVQSVEIVPSSVDDAVIVNYVHSWELISCREDT